MAEEKDFKDLFSAPQVEGPFATARAHISHNSNSTEQKESYEFHHEVFVMYREITGCNRCSKLIANGDINFEDNPSYKCPHNDKEAYEKIRQKSIEGVYRLGNINEQFTKEGAVLISVSWVAPVSKNKNSIDSKDNKL